MIYYAYKLNKICIDIKQVLNMVNKLARLLLILIFHPYILAESIPHSDPIDVDMFEHHTVFKWNLIEEHLISTNQHNQSVTYFDIKSIQQTQFRKGFGYLDNIEYLYQEKKKLHQSIGYILPRLQFLAGPESFPLQLLGFFGSVFGFLLPYNWYKLFEHKQYYEARKYAFLDMIMDQNMTSKILYYQVHHEKVAYNILLSFRDNLFSLTKHFYKDYYKTQKPQLLSSIELLESYDSELMRKIFESRKYILQNTPNLGTILAFTHSTGHVDIKKISLPKIEHLQFYNKEQVIKNARERSLVLKQQKHLIKAAKHHINATIHGPLTGNDRGEEYHTFGISIGMDSLASIKISKSDLQLLKINYKKSKSILDQTLTQLIYVYNEHIRDLNDAISEEESGIGKIKIALRHSIMNHNEGKEDSIDIHILEFYLETKLKINFILHEILILKTQIDRLLIEPLLDDLIKIPTVTKELKKLKKWASKKKIIATKNLQKN